MANLIDKWIAMQAVQGIDCVATLRDGDLVIRMSAVEHVLENLPEAPDINVGSMDAISRRQALETIRTRQTYKLFSGDDMVLVDKAEVQTELMMLPSVQSERKKGEWTKDGACQFCGFQPWYERDIHTLSFCPNCGADMRGGKDG